MKKKYILMGAFAAALTSASVVYAYDAQTQMDDQTGQTQTTPAMPATTDNQNANQPSQMNTTDGAAQGNMGDMNMPPSPPPPSNNNN